MAATARTSLITAIAALVLTAGPLQAQEAEESEAAGEAGDNVAHFDHSDWDTIVRTYVTAEQRFDYEALMANEAHLELLGSYLDRVAGANLSALPEAERLAFWLNAYNACTVRGVVDHWPTAGVLEVEGFFDSIDYRVAQSELTLNELENERIRAVFAEPRIHFAVNCASVGCPPLRPEAYVGGRLEAQLEAQAGAFVRASTEVDANQMQVRLSQIFEWFGGDFEAAGGVREFVASRLDEPEATAVRTEGYQIQFVPYDWSLNKP